MKNQTICLNMIVKNEAHCILDTLVNLCQQLDFSYWVISDTGSTDNTKEVITKFFKEKNIPGKIVDHQWLNFGYNRSKALESAYNLTDYLLIFDADDKLIGDFKLPEPMHLDRYMLTFGGDGVSYVRPLLVNNRKKWEFKGVLHEALNNLDPINGEATIEGKYHVVSGRIGARSQNVNKYYDDALILKKGFTDEFEKDYGQACRYAFYIGQSYKDAGDKYIDESIEWYKKVLTLHNWDQEKFYSCFMIGDLYLRKNDGINALKYWLKSVEYDSERVEGVVNALNYLRLNENTLLVSLLYKKFANYKRSKDLQGKLFIVNPMFNDEIEFHYSICAFYAGELEEGYNCCKKILTNQILRYDYLKLTMTNMLFYKDIMLKDTSTNLLTLFYDVNSIFNTLGKNNDKIEVPYIELWNLLFEQCKPILVKYNSKVIKKIKEKVEHTEQKQVNIFLSFTTCKRFDLFQQTINSLINNCTDIDKIDYWFCVDDNSSEQDRQYMQKLYPWINYYMKKSEEKGHRESMNIIFNKLEELKPDYWIHLEDDFLFYDKMNYIGDSIQLLTELKDQNVNQILFNRNYGETIKCYNILGHLTPVKQANKLEYVLHDYKHGQFPYSNCHYWPHYSFRPSLIRVDTILQLGNYNSPNQFFEMDYAHKWTSSGYKSAFFNKLTNKHIGRLTSERNDSSKPNAYTLNEERQFSLTEMVVVQQPSNKSIQIVNLKRRVDRKEQTIKVLNDAQIDPQSYEFIEATDGQSLEPTKELARLFKDNDFGSRRGFIGCALSHYNLWKQLTTDPTNDYYVIMEDDFSLCTQFKEKYLSMEGHGLFKKEELLFLGYHMYSGEREKVKDLYNNNTSIIGIAPLNKSLYIGATFMYSINKIGASKLLNYIEQNGIKHGIDYLIKICPELQSREMRPQLAFSEWVETPGQSVDTDIQTDSIGLDFSKIKDINTIKDINNMTTNYIFIPNVDHIGDDICFNRLNIQDMMIFADKDNNCAGFNTLGFFKSKIDTNNLKLSQYFGPTDGIYIKKMHQPIQSIQSIELHTVEKIYNNDNKILNDVFIETGAYLGGGIQAALNIGFKEIHCIELAEKYYNICKNKFKDYPQVHLHLGDSGVVLPKIIKNINKGITFWLDGHYSSCDTACATDYCSPIQLELDAIKQYNHPDHVILIDDMKDFTQESIDWNNKVNNKCGYITKNSLEDTLTDIHSDRKIYYFGPACVCYNILKTNNFISKVITGLNNIFIYWTGIEYKLINILRNIIYLYSTKGKGYNVHYITDKNVNEYISQIPSYFNTLLPAHKADFIRVNVICDYGGIWLDSDTLVMDNLESLIDIFDTKNGFFIKENNTILWNGIFGSKPNTQVMLEWKQTMLSILNSKQHNIEWAEIGNNCLQTIFEKTDYFNNYTIFNGLDNMYPVNWCDCITEFIDNPYDNYKNIIREYQPVLVLVNSVYKKMENLTVDEILNGNMPIHYFIKKAYENMNHLKDLNFIEIGTSNFDTLIENANDTDYGITIEPLSYYLNSLPNKTNVIKINKAVTDIVVNDKVTMFYIPEDIIKQNNLPEWFKGCNTIHNFHPLHIKHNVQSYVIKEPVDIISFQELLYTNTVRRINYLKIDTEGHDYIILQGLYKYIKYLPIEFHPLKIKFESNEHTNPIDVDNILLLYYSIGYNLISRDNYDTLIEKTNIKQIIQKRIKLICNWTTSDKLCKEWSEYYHNTYKNITMEFTHEDINIDNYVIINFPAYNEYYDPLKTIVFQMEPWVNDLSKNWGVKTWGEWAIPDPTKFLHVYKPKNLCINTFKNIHNSINNVKLNMISSICSNRNVDEGHILRNQFIKYIEKSKVNNDKQYFSNTLSKCKNNNNLHKYIVNPIMGYYICDQFIGNDYTNKPDSYDILKYGFKEIEYMQVLYVQVNFFEYFCKNILPKITTQFILITGQFHLPQLHISELTELVLNNIYVTYWFSQNPIYESHPKYISIPYGIYYEFLPNYVNKLIEQNDKQNNQEQNQLYTLKNLYITKTNHKCRNILPDVSKVDIDIYYQQLSECKFILSPIGDRPDCYRHWEAIGLGVIPITNIPSIYKSLFGKNMFYVEDTTKMCELLNDNSVLQSYSTELNKDIICVDYWKDIIQEYKSKININVFGQQNYHQFKSYIGPLKDDDKMNGLLPYKYHFAAENNSESNYATEKIWEPILCESLCFYWGCPNLHEYIDPQAYVQLPLDNFEESLKIVKQAIEEDWWSQRIDVIRREKQKIINELGFFPMLNNIINK